MPMSPRDEFNLQGLNKVRTTLRAGLLALPGVAVMGMHYGLTGLAVTAALVGGLAWLQKQGQKLHILAPELGEGIRDIRDIRDILFTDRENRIADVLTRRMNMPPAAVQWAALTSTLAGTDGASIILRPTVKSFSDEQAAFVIAHELDHIRNPHDELVETAFKNAGTFGLIWTAVAAAGQTNGWFDIATTQHLPALFGGAVITLASFALAARAVEQEVELRCDGNALRATRDPDAARFAIHYIDCASRQPAHTGTPLKNLWRALNHFSQGNIIFSSHPSTNVRLANIVDTWHQMGREGTTRPVPVLPAQDTDLSALHHTP